jgi:acyl carrier protein
MERDEAYRAVSETFGEYFEVHPGQVHAHHELRGDWGVSGQELELLAHHIEERAGVELNDHSALAELKTIGQLVRLVRAQLRRAARVETAAACS